MQILGIQFRNNGTIYEFLNKKEDVKSGDFVVVETPHGQEFCQVKKILEKSKTDQSELKEIKFKASPRDIEQNNAKKIQAKKDKKIIQKIVDNLGLKIKISEVLYTFNSSKIFIYFVSEERIDFRELLKELTKIYKCKIELKQIGIRDETRNIGGVGICGRVCCCTNHLKQFNKVSIKMAKNQNLSLNPTKISGLCGKLLCCLEYENANYEDMGKLMPRINSRISTPDGEGVVIYNNILKQKTTVKIFKNDSSFTIGEYPVSETKVINVQN